MRRDAIQRTVESVRRTLESLNTHCEFYKAEDGKWYLEFADDYNGRKRDANTYGPFASEEEAKGYMDREFSNPGGWTTDDSGERPVPTESPNGSPVKEPKQPDSSWGW